MEKEPIIVNVEKKQGNIFVVYINGNIICNLSGTCVRDEVDKILETNNPRIVLNIRDVRYLDSYSFGWLIKTHKDAKAKNGNFAICDLNDDILGLMQMVNFDKAVKIFKKEEDAIAEMQK